MVPQTLEDKKLKKHFGNLNSAPKEIFYKGNLALLDRYKVALIGSRRVTQYTALITNSLSATLNKYGATIVSGGAMGIDALAHNNAKDNILISPVGIDDYAPKSHKALFERISTEGLLLSEYSKTINSKSSFILRNRLIIALSDIVIIPQADLNSGSSNSLNLAIKMGKKTYTIPQRIGESAATNEALKLGLISCIYDVTSFCNDLFGFLVPQGEISSDEAEILEFCKNGIEFESALEKFGDKILELELEGKLARKSGSIITL